MHEHIFAYSSPPPAGPSIPPAPPGLGCSVRLIRVAGGGFKKTIKNLKCDRAHLRGVLGQHSKHNRPKRNKTRTSIAGVSATANQSKHGPLVQLAGCFALRWQNKQRAGAWECFCFAKQTPRPATCFEKQTKHTAASGLFGCGDGTYPSKENRWKAKAKQQTTVASGVVLIALIARYSVPLFGT